MASTKSIVNRVTGVNRSKVTKASRNARRRAVRNIFRRKSTGGAGG